MRTRTTQRHGTGERGAMTLELVLLFPLLCVLTWMSVQAAVYYHARQVAAGAAQAGANSAARQGAGAGDGRASALGFVDRAGGSQVLDQARATVGPSGTMVTVTVTGRAPQIVPFWNVSVRQVASAPRERVTP